MLGFMWQRNYYEHIIRDQTELKNVREYIKANPLKWSQDEENPEAVIFNAIKGRNVWK